MPAHSLLVHITQQQIFSLHHHLLKCFPVRNRKVGHTLILMKLQDTFTLDYTHNATACNSHLTCGKYCVT